MIDATGPRIVNENKHIVLFDGKCNLCSFWVRFLIKRDPRSLFRFCSVQSETGIALLSYCGLPVDQIETMVYIDHGKVYLRSTAVLQLTKKLPALWPALAVCLYIPEPIRDYLYALIARNRYRIAGKKSQCFMPADALKTRFIQ